MSCRALLLVLALYASPSMSEDAPPQQALASAASSVSLLQVPQQKVTEVSKALPQEEEGADDQDEEEADTQQMSRKKTTTKMRLATKTNGDVEAAGDEDEPTEVAFIQEGAEKTRKMSKENEEEDDEEEEEKKKEGEEGNEEDEASDAAWNEEEEEEAGREDVAQKYVKTLNLNNERTLLSGRLIGKQNAALDAQTQAIVKAMNDQTDVIRKQDAALDAKIDVLAKAIADQNHLVNNPNTPVLNTRIDNVNTRIDNVNTRMKNVNTRIDNVNTRIDNTLSTKIDGNTVWLAQALRTGDDGVYLSVGNQKQRNKWSSDAR